MLTKEECLKALDILTKHECCCCDFEDDECLCQCALEQMLNQLIEEHFDNPPLKFEELRKNMWVWDDVKKNYDQMKRITIINSEKRPYKYIDFERNGVIEFEEGRFYRKQVE